MITCYPSTHCVAGLLLLSLLLLLFVADVFCLYISARVSSVPDLVWAPFVGIGWSGCCALVLAVLATAAAGY